MIHFEPHVFSEVWSTHMEFFVEQCLVENHALGVIQSLIVQQPVSQQLVGILLKYLMDHLKDVGGYTSKQTSLALRLFKISFLATNQFITENESVLVPHLQKLILDSFSLAAKAQDPTTYYHILRALFR